MAIHEFEPQAETPLPQIRLLREVADGSESIYHFYVDGEESSVTLAREDSAEQEGDFTYAFRFYGWKFGEADVHHTDEINSIDWQGIPNEGMDELARIQAQRLLGQSGMFLIEAIRADFPETPVIEDADGILL